MNKNAYGVRYPVEFFNPHVHLEYDCTSNHSDLNEAEMKALKYEEYKNKKEENKKIKNKEFIDKYNKNVLIYQEEQKMKNKEEEFTKRKEKEEKLLKKQNFIKTVYEKNMKPFSQRNQKSKSLNKININTNKTKTKKGLKQIKVINHMNENNENYNLEINNFLDKENFSPKKTVLKEINNNENQLDNIDNLDNNNLMSQNFEIGDINNDNEKIDKNLDDNKKDKNTDLKLNSANSNSNTNIIDLRGNIEEQLLEEIKNKKIYHNNELKEKIDEKMSNIKRFRNQGILPPKNDKVENKKKKKQIKNKKFFSEFERRRFIKALKHIITERLGEHNIIIQNICNCGNFQKQLTALVEQGNLTVYALTEVECANNCVFYKNKKYYLKCINDVLNSIKDIAYENFHNKYKDNF